MQDREQPVLPMAPGVAERRTHPYVRNGTTSLFAALDVATGAVIGQCYKRHRATKFLDFLKRIDAEDQGLARTPPTLACSLHANVGILDQSGRAGGSQN